MNIVANKACNGAENIPLDNKNSAAQQNIIGVIMNTLYGLPLAFHAINGYLSNFGSRTLNTMTPNTVIYVKPGSKDVLVRKTNSMLRRRKT
jgi:hypothetical protein